MMEQLDGHIARAKTAQIKEALVARKQWLADRKPYQMALYSTNLELVIDGNVKDSNLLAALGNTSEVISDFHEACQIYPWMALNTGRKQADGTSRRVPLSKLAKKDFIHLDSLMCRSLKEILKFRKISEEWFKEHQWRMVAPAAIEVTQAYPVDKEIVRIVNGDRKEGTPGICGTWRKEWQDAIASGVADSDRNATYERIEGLITKELMQYPPDQRKEIAVQIYRKVYRTQYANAQLNDEGERRIFADGLLWVPAIGNSLLAVFDEVGVSGRYETVDLDEANRNLVGSQVGVEVRNGVVVRVSDGNVLGFSSKVPNGKYQLDYFAKDQGLIMVKAPSEAVLPVANDSFDNEAQAV